jgi:hypothetical protein
MTDDRPVTRQDLHEHHTTIMAVLTDILEQKRIMNGKVADIAVKTAEHTIQILHLDAQQNQHGQHLTDLQSRESARDVAGAKGLEGRKRTITVWDITLTLGVVGATFYLLTILGWHR